MRATTWLEGVTGRSAAWWMAACQKAVQRASSPSDDPNHDQTDTPAFLGEVVRLVCEAMPVPDDAGAPYDPNMRGAATLAVVTALWYGRLHYAKAHDPARPVGGRQRAYGRWADWALALVSAVYDEREDPAYFPGQRWDHPFAFEAEDGDFV